MTADFLPLQVSCELATRTSLCAGGMSPRFHIAQAEEAPSASGVCRTLGTPKLAIRYTERLDLVALLWIGRFEFGGGLVLRPHLLQRIW